MPIDVTTATPGEIQAEIENLQGLFENLTPTKTTVSYDNRTYTAAQLQKEITRLRDSLPVARERETKARTEAKSLQSDIKKAEIKLRTATDEYQRVIRFNLGNLLETATTDYENAYATLQKLDPMNALLGKSETAQQTETERLTGQAVAIQGDRGRAAAAARLQGQVGAKPTTTAPKAPTPAAVKPVASSEWIETQLELRGLDDTPANRKMLQGEYKTQKPAVWNDTVQQEFLSRYPQFSFLFDAEVFGDSADAIKNIAVRAITEKWYRYPTTSSTVIKRLIAATPYGIRSSDAQEKFDALGLAEQNAKIDQKARELKDLYGGLGLDETTWRTLAKTASRNGLDEATTRANLFKTIYETTPEGAMRYDKAVKILEQGKLGQDVRKVYRDYGLNPNDPNVAADIQAYTTGTKTIEDIKLQAVGIAKDLFPSMAASIDRGSTVKQIADQYAAYAADILELPIQSIDMTTSKFRKAFEGEKLMSIGDWQKMLRSDPNYGWQYTSTANKQAVDVGMAIARAFGAVK